MLYIYSRSVCVSQITDSTDVEVHRDPYWDRIEEDPEDADDEARDYDDEDSIPSPTQVLPLDNHGHSSLTFTKISICKDFVC